MNMEEHIQRGLRYPASAQIMETLDSDRDRPLDNLPVLIGDECIDWFDCVRIIQCRYMEDEVSWN